ncbi:MAG: class I SAM-dependent RNA methyltransferase, partial [Kordiimonas sp.]
KSVVLGFTKKQSHQIVDIKDCPVTRAEITDLIKPLRSILVNILPNRMQVELHITVTATGIDLLIDAPLELDLKARELLVEFANKYDVAAIHFRDQGFLDPVVIRRTPMMALSCVKAPLSPAAFVQASEEGEKALVREVLKACRGSKRVADLFCGMGTFTFPLAQEYQVLAVEGSKQALDALRAGANQASGLKQIVAKHRDLYRRPMTAKELSAFDAVVFDPPRAGAKEQAQELAQSNVSKVIAVSCNPNTFSRDARFLADGGYQLNRVVPVDQFLWSPHLELVGIFSKP